MQARPRQNLLNQNNNFNTNNVSYNILDNNNLADNQVRRNRPGQVNTNNNVFLPPITENGQSQGPIPNYQRNVQSREREKADFQNPMMVDNYTKNANSDNENVIIAEINNLKKLVKKLYEGQTDTQMRLNDYSKIFSEHDTISRINNLKINEHDTKITEILMSFNNYLSLNDQSTKALNDLTSNYDSVARKTEIIDIRNKFSIFDKAMESRLLEISGKYEDLYVKYQEISKEQEVFQKYTLEKLKNYQLDNADNKILQQQAIIKMEESKENKVMFQIDTLRNMLRTCEKNIKSEETMRKSSLDNLRSELLNFFQSLEEKISFSEKNNLESEKKMLNYSKEYITGMRDLMTQSQQKTEIEIRALKSIVDANVGRLDNRVDETLRIVEDSTNEVKAIHNEVRSQYNDLDGFMRENFDGIENKLVTNSTDIQKSQEKIKKLSQTVKLMLSDNVNLIESKVNEAIKNTDYKFTKYIEDLNENMKIFTAKVENILQNQKDSIEMMKKEHFEDNEMMKEKIQKRLKEIDVDSLYIDKKISENFEKIKDDQKDFKQFITELSNQRISEVKIDLSNEYKELLKKLSDSLDNKVTVMKNDEIEKKRIDDISAEGRIQGYIIEAEKRIKKNLEERIDKIQQTVEKMNIKINAE